MAKTILHSFLRDGVELTLALQSGFIEQRFSADVTCPGIAERHAHEHVTIAAL